MRNRLLSDTVNKNPDKNNRLFENKKTESIK